MKISITLISFLFSSVAFSNVLGNMQTFAPNPDSYIFQNIHSSRTLDQGMFNIGFFVGYVRNELSVYDDLTTPEFVEYKDRASTFDAVFGYGFTDHFEFTYALPGYIQQEPDSGQLNSHYISNGINGHRLGFKYDVSQEKTGGFAVSSSVDFTESQENPYIGNSPNPILNIELIYDQRDFNSGWGANLGYRSRSPGKTTINSYFLPVEDQLLFSAGYVYGLSKRIRFHLELFSAFGLKQGEHPDSKYINSNEVLLGAKYKLMKNLWWHFGGTIEAIPEGLAPDYRIYTGINYYFFNKDSDDQSDSEKAVIIARPPSLDLYTEESQQIQVLGGYPPYKFDLENNFGSFSSKTMEYQAPDEEGQDTLIITDTRGKEATVTINVSEKAKAPGFELLPDPARVYVGGTLKLKPVNGYPPFIITSSDSSYGSLSDKNLIYRAKMIPGETEVTVQDRLGRLITKKIEIIPIQKPNETFVLKNMNFVFDTAQLTPKSKSELQKNILKLKKIRIRKMLVIGHADSLGDADYNQDLSQLRAETVAQIIRENLDLADQAVESLGYGESQPIATNETEEGRSINRRVELKIYYDR